MGAKLSVSIFVNHGIMSSQITLQTSPTAEDGNSNTIEAVVESTDKVIDSPFMANSNDGLREVQSKEACGAHENSSSNPHLNQKKKITKWSCIDRPNNEEKFQTLDEKKDGGKRKFTQSDSHSELPSKRQQVLRGDRAECYSMVEADAQLRQAL